MVVGAVCDSPVISEEHRILPKASFLDCAKTIPLSGLANATFILCFSGLKGQGQAQQFREAVRKALQAQSKLVRHTVTHCGSVKQKKAKATDVSFGGYTGDFSIWLL